MAKYRKRPTVIEATQWQGLDTHHDGIVPYTGPYITCEICGKPAQDHGWIATLEGGHIVCEGDWIITGIAGEKYTCKPQIFAATYEAVIEDYPGPSYVPLLEEEEEEQP